MCYSASRSETKELFSSGALFIVAKEARETVYNVNELSTFLRSCLSIEEKLGERERERERKKHHWEKNQTRSFFAKTYTKPAHFALFPLSISTSLWKLLLLHNLSRINTHDKFTLEDAVITEMIGSKLRIFFKSRDARYRSLAPRVVWACFCYNLVTFLLHISSTFPHIIAPCNGFSSHNLAKPSNVTYLFLLWSFACILTRIWGL